MAAVRELGISLREQIDDLQNTYLLWLAYAVVLPGWIMLTMAPSSALTSSIVYCCAAVAGVLNTIALFVDQMTGLAPRTFQRKTEHGLSAKKGGFFSVNGIVTIYKTAPVKMILGMWIHYLSFDLIVADQVRLDALESGLLPWPLVAASLVVLCVFGPCGALLYCFMKCLALAGSFIFG